MESMFGGGGDPMGGGNFGYENGVMMTRDPKPRLRWTADLHDRFVSAVTKLGGPDKATPKSVLRLMGMKGLTLYHLKSHLQKYRLGQQARRQSPTEQHKHLDNGVCGSSYVHFSNQGSTANLSNSGNQQGRETPVDEALKCQIEVQKRLQEQLEVQRKLQMRIEAQGKYLHAILEKAQTSLSLDMNSSGSLEATKAQLTDFNTALSSLMKNMSEGGKENVMRMSDGYKKSNGEAFRIFEGQEERKDNGNGVKIEGGPIDFDLNTNGNFDFVGGNWS